KAKLSPTGNARLYAMPLIVKWDLFRQLPYKDGAFRTRPDKGHIPFEHIENLWQLINTHLADKGSDSGDARVVFLRPDRLPGLFRIHTHTAELDDIKTLAIQPHPFLLIENRG